MTKISIDIDQLTKRYSTKVAVNKLSLSIEQGEVFGFLGHNGAGKTTTIQLLTTLIAPDSGTARICGHDVVKESAQVRQKIGYVPENVRLYDTMTAYENLRFFAELSGVKKVASRIDETLEFFNSNHLADLKVGSLSKGMRQRIGLAQAILHRPEVLFLDEPASGLDPLGIKNLRENIIRLNQNFGMTIFMNTHLISEIAKTCTSIGVLSHGQLVYQDGIENVTKHIGDDASLEALYMSVIPEQIQGENSQ